MKYVYEPRAIITNFSSKISSISSVLWRIRDCPFYHAVKYHQSLTEKLFMNIVKYIRAMNKNKHTRIVK